MANKIAHAAERVAFEKVLDTIGKKAVKDRDYVKVIDAIQKINGDTWPEEGYERLRKTFSKGGKWAGFFDNLLDNVDLEYLKGLIMSFGFEAGFTGYKETRKNAKKYGVSIPWVILFDPTSACNLHCTGCWASEYSHQLNLSYEDMDKIVTEGKELGIHGYVMTGGEPTVRKNDIFKLAEKHKDCGFMLFTNGTLIDQAFCDEMKKTKNIVLSMSIEGYEDTTDLRRGAGTFQKVMNAMDLLRKNGLVYGTSICYTRANCEAVTSDEFLDFLISKGVTFSWYFHFMPVGMDSTPELMPTPEQREYMYHRIREVRGYEGGKPIFTMDFQNDGEWVSGCIAGGKDYCHINPNGDMEPCVFIHYSSANIHEKSLLECLQQPLFKAYQANQPFNKNLLRPCPMLENPQFLRQMVKETGAHSTDMTEPESAEHLTAKCDDYSKEWAPVAEKLWASDHPGYKPEA
jgi:MoaA/NifB/PqqE/SkfB family radical SAM enzyme